MSQVRILSSRSYSSSEDVSLYFYESLTTISCKLRLYSGENLVGSLLFGLFVNCSGLPKSHILERTKSVLSFLIFKAMRILVLKLSKFRKPKALRLMTLMRLLVASSFAFE